MEIKDIIKCENDNILPIQSKMIANLLLSGSPYQIYQYKDVSNDIYNKYNAYIRYHMRFDKNINIKNNVAPKDVGYYAGELSWLCVKLELPLISVKINSENDMPNEGFFVFPQCQEMQKQGILNKDIVKQIKSEVTEALEDGLYDKLIDYLNGVSSTNDMIEQNSKLVNISKDDSNATLIKSSANMTEQKSNKEDYSEAEFLEGQIKERTILQRKRNQEIVNLAKQRDNYTCRVCGFSYQKKIVEAHHLIPISNKSNEYEIKIENLITLCPNCHSLAHHLLNENEIYVDKLSLIPKLKEIINSK